MDIEEKQEPHKLDMPLENRMKFYESKYDISIPNDQPYIVRLDGNRFSKFTRHLKQPFDNNFIKAMMLTMSDLLTTYRAMTAYSHSDEITLIFPAIPPEMEAKGVCHIFNGRVCKIISEMASYCSLRFTYYLKKYIEGCMGVLSNFDYVQAEACLLNPVLNFDARILVFPKGDEHEIINHMIWRSMRDCPRNCLAKIGQHYLTKNEIKSDLIHFSDNCISKLLKKNIDWDTYPIYLKHGIYCKNHFMESIKRNIMVFKTIEIKKYNTSILEILLNKDWNDTQNVNIDIVEISDIKLEDIQ